jgi:hypothetical protein
MRTLASEELKLVYGGTDSGGCKPTTKPSCSKSKPSKASCSKSRSKSKSHHDNGHHYGWCHKKD